MTTGTNCSAWLAGYVEAGADEAIDDAPEPETDDDEETEAPPESSPEAA